MWGGYPPPPPIGIGLKKIFPSLSKLNQLSSFYKMIPLTSWPWHFYLPSLLLVKGERFMVTSCKQAHTHFILSSCLLSSFQSVVLKVFGKGTVDVISSKARFTECHVRFTKVPCTPLFSNWGAVTSGFLQNRKCREIFDTFKKNKWRYFFHRFLIQGRSLNSDMLLNQMVVSLLRLHSHILKLKMWV